MLAAKNDKLIIKNAAGKVLKLPITVMKKLTKRILKDESIFRDQAEIEILRRIYEEALDVFIDGNYPDGSSGDSLMCSIHRQFPHGHNCVACNLNTQNKLIERYLLGYKSFVDLHLVSTNFIMLLYLLVERYQTYFKIIELPESYRIRYFSVFQQVVHWANFLKHPKSFMLSHHAGFYIENHIMPSSTLLSEVLKSLVVIDNKFTKEYYSGDKNNNKLYNLMKKKENIHVIFPDPVQLIKEFVIAQKTFVEMIAQNEIIRDVLNNEATISEYFANAAADE